MIPIKAKMILVFLLIVLSIIAVGYCFLGYVMIGSFSVTPGYPKEQAETQAFLWLGGMALFSISAVLLKIFLLNKLVKEDEASKPKMKTNE